MKLVSAKHNDEIDIHFRHLVGACRVSDFLLCFRSVTYFSCVAKVVKIFFALERQITRPALA